MGKPQPLVSVVTPVHNGETYLSKCIESVLSQTYSNFEYIIVNNASEDDTARIAEDFASRDGRIRVVHTDTLLPIMKNWNHSVSRISANSEYCKVVHADDWLLPACLDEMVRVASSRSSIAIIGSYCLWRNRVTCDGLPHDSEILPGKEVCSLTLRHKTYPFLSPSCLLINSERIRQNRPFYNEALIYADVDMCYRLLEDSDFGFVHQVLTCIRWHDDSLTQTFEKPWAKSRLWNLDLLLRYGPIYLSQEEFEGQLNSDLAGYYRYLVRATRKGMDPAFWKYHRSELTRLGHSFSKTNLRIARLINLFDRVGTRLRRKTNWSRGRT